MIDHQKFLLHLTKKMSKMSAVNASSPTPTREVTWICFTETVGRRING